MLENKININSNNIEWGKEDSESDSEENKEEQNLNVFDLEDLLKEDSEDEEENNQNNNKKIELDVVENAEYKEIS